MSTTDIVAVVVAAVVVALVCAVFLARTRQVPPTPRLPLALGAAAGLAALVAVLVVHLVPAAGQGDPLGTIRSLVTTGAEALVRPATIVVVVLAAVVGALLGGFVRRGR